MLQRISQGECNKGASIMVVACFVASLSFFDLNTPMNVEWLVSYAFVLLQIRSFTSECKIGIGRTCVWVLMFPSTTTRRSDRLAAPGRGYHRFSLIRLVQHGPFPIWSHFYSIAASASTSLELALQVGKGVLEPKLEQPIADLGLGLKTNHWSWWIQSFG